MYRSTAGHNNVFEGVKVDWNFEYENTCKLLKAKNLNINNILRSVEVACMNCNDNCLIKFYELFDKLQKMNKKVLSAHFVH